MRDLPQAEINQGIGVASRETRPSVVEAPSKEKKPNIFGRFKDQLSSLFSRNSDKSEPINPRIQAQAESLLRAEESNAVLADYSDSIERVEVKQDVLKEQTVAKLEKVTEKLDPMGEDVTVTPRESMWETAKIKSNVHDPLSRGFYETLKGLQKRGLFDAFRSQDQMVKMLAEYTNRLELAQSSLRSVLNKREETIDGWKTYQEVAESLLAKVYEAEESLAYYMEVINKQSGPVNRRPVFAQDKIDRLKNGAAETSYKVKEAPVFPRSTNPSGKVHRGLHTRNVSWQNVRGESPLSV